MKARRYIFASSTLILLVAGLYTGEKLYYMGFAILMAFVFYAAVTNLWVLLDFRYLQTVTPMKANKGQEAVLSIQIHNDKPFIFPYIKLFYNTPTSLLMNAEKEDVLSILPFRHGEIREEFVCSLRGQYALGIDRIEVGDIFGLFTFSMNLSRKPYYKPLLLTVYPRVLKLSHLPLPEIQQEGAAIHQLLKTEEAATLSEIREYRYGDPLKRIHWKLSSKLQKIQVMNYEMTTQPHTLLFIEAAPSAAPGIAKYQVEDQIVEVAAAIIHYILIKWLPVKMVVYRKDRQELNGREPHHFQAFYEFISGMTFDSGFSMSEIIQLEAAAFIGQGSMILIVHHLTYALFNHLCILKQSGIYPLVFLVLHRSQDPMEAHKMIAELNERVIPAFILYTDQRLDESLEAII